ncbi:Replication factor C small subunit [uncultured virus]|nr:Replication factor C small subunit [uncultured virus]
MTEWKNSNDTLPWVEKYRPKTLDEIMYHERIISTLKTFIKNKCLPHLLLYGPSGTGKTSCITACAKELYGKYYPVMVMELNASDDRGIEVVRNRIKQFVSSKNVFYGETEKERNNIFKLVILDETDAMTGDAQAILRKIVEKYTYNTRFCLICNYIQNIIPALQSRCARFRFTPLDDKSILFRVNQIISRENIKVTKSGINTILKRANGDMRKVLNNLQSVSMAYPLINEENVNMCLGYPRKIHIDKIIDQLINEPFEKCYQNIYNLKFDLGLSLDDIIQELHDLLVTKIIENYCENNNINKLSVKTISSILDKMRTIEYNQSINTTENIQLSGLIGIFKLII